MFPHHWSLPRFGPIARLSPGGIGADTICQIGTGIGETAAHGRSALGRLDCLGTEELLERLGEMDVVPKWVVFRVRHHDPGIPLVAALGLVGQVGDAEPAPVGDDLAGGVAVAHISQAVAEDDEPVK